MVGRDGVRRQGVSGVLKYLSDGYEVASPRSMLLYSWRSLIDVGVNLRSKVWDLVGMSIDPEVQMAPLRHAYKA